MAKKRKSFSHGRAKEAVLEMRGSLTLRPRPKPPRPKTPEEIKVDIERSNAWLEEYLNSPEFAEECRKAEEKEKRREKRRLARETERAAARGERRRNPKSPIDAYYNHMEKCPYASGTKERRAWKKENPTFEFNGVTYRDHWSPQLSNSGRTTRWMGYLCQSACKFDPSSASNFDPFPRRGLLVALVSSELAGIAEARRARVA